jgi:hypothetical protein
LWYFLLIIYFLFVTDFIVFLGHPHKTWG